jgi:hypothetical protein
MSFVFSLTKFFPVFSWKGDTDLCSSHEPGLLSWVSLHFRERLASFSLLCIRTHRLSFSVMTSTVKQVACYFERRKIDVHLIRHLQLIDHCWCLFHLWWDVTSSRECPLLLLCKMHCSSRLVVSFLDSVVSSRLICLFHSTWNDLMGFSRKRHFFRESSETRDWERQWKMCWNTKENKDSRRDFCRRDKINSLSSRFLQVKYLVLACDTKENNEKEQLFHKSPPWRQHQHRNLIHFPRHSLTRGIQIPPHPTWNPAKKQPSIENGLFKK